MQKQHFYPSLLALILFAFILSPGICFAQEWNPTGATPADPIDRPANVDIGLSTTNYSATNNNLEVDAGIVTYSSTNAVTGRNDANGTNGSGSSTGILGSAYTWAAHGGVRGVTGSVTADVIRTIFADKIAVAEGGGFTSTIDEPIPAGSEANGPYWIAGVRGRLRGNITNYPVTGFVSAVAGVDDIKGTGTFGGWFDGRGYFSDNVGIGTQTPITRLDVREGNIFTSPNGTTPFPDLFAAMGSSFGNCENYGFRAQRTTDYSINVGLEENVFPTISWANAEGVGSLDFDCDNNEAGCGTLIARMNCDGDYAFEVFGRGYFSGGVFTPSDKTLKTAIEEIVDPMERIRALRGVSYTYNQEVYPEYRFPTEMQYGFIAQEVEEVIPEAVIKDENDVRAVNYDMVIPFLVEGMQQLDEEEQTAQATIEAQEARIEALESELEALKAMVKDLCTQTGNNAAKAEQGLGSANEVRDVPTLAQNVPNPFSSSTRIDYYVPETASSASIAIFNVNGDQVLEYQASMGVGSVEVPASALSDGIYFYSLMVDGTKVQTRRMALTK